MNKADSTPAPNARAVRVTFQPAGQSFEVIEGDTLFEIAAEAGVEVDTVCGGNGSCGKCKVRFEEAAPDPSPQDYMHLSGGELGEGYRLSCQIHADRDMTVHVPPHGARARVQILHHGVERDVELHPDVRKVFIPYVKPRDRENISDWDSARNVLPRKLRPTHISINLLRTLPAAIRHESGMTLTIANRRVIAIEEGNTAASLYGVALDIGSTTLVGFLVDLGTGEDVAVASAVNKQAVFGDDIIGRLARTQRNPEGLEKLHTMVIEQINTLLAELAEQSGIDIHHIAELTVVGNMAMHHFLLRLDSTFLGLSPYAPVIRESITVTAGDLGLDLNPEAQIFVLPNIAGFVGSDTVGVMLATDIAASDGYRMIIDVGTNGEMALANRRRQIACSAPAGPALEGARIKMGMRAAPGAIDHITITDDVAYTVIGDLPPVGLCGSALIDVVAQLRKSGLMSESGAYNRKKNMPADTPAALLDRLVEAEQRKDTYFILARAEESGADKDVIFTQNDIRECQLAKGAIRAGTMLLLDEMGITEDDLEVVQLAGAFGNFLDPANARAAGLTPQVPLDRIQSVGNAAGVGARLALVSVLERRKAVRLAQRTEHIQLSGSSEFQTAFGKAMLFPT